MLLHTLNRSVLLLLLAQHVVQRRLHHPAELEALSPHHLTEVSWSSWCFRPLLNTTGAVHGACRSLLLLLIQPRLSNRHLAQSGLPKDYSVMTKDESLSFTPVRSLLLLGVWIQLWLSKPLLQL